MKGKWMILIGCLLGITGCLREKYDAGNCSGEVFFHMEDVPYRFEGEEVTGYRPYSAFTEKLHILAFADQHLEKVQQYGYQYCREHFYIPWETGFGRQTFLFVANLYDEKELDWTFAGDTLDVVFSIVDHEEPPVLLAAVKEADLTAPDTLGIGLRLMVSRLEIQLENPPAWVTGLWINVREVAAKMTINGDLQDTTSIRKELPLQHEGAGTYWTGINTFPTYPGSPALVDVRLTGEYEVLPLAIADERLHFQPGRIIRVNIRFETEQDITISVKIVKEWEIVDGGHIII